MEKVGVLVVSYGAREAAIVDALKRSKNYEVDLYIADKQRNPFNAERAAQHVVIPDLDVEQICIFAEKNKDKIDFAIVGPEKPIIAGIRDLVEQRLRVPVICPTKECAIEASKVQQRLLFQEIVPEVNPRFKIFNPEDYRGLEMVKRAVYDWLDILENEAVVKPDKPAAGKGVGVWGDHFVTRKQLFEHFISNLKYGSVIIEEKLDGEETSFQVLSDGKHMVPLPDVRDYKRAFNDDRGPNTGGMGSYKNTSNVLPFITEAERKCELEVATEIFEKWKTQIQDNSALRGVPLYLAFMHTKDGVKILETNSRPGDPEIINILPLIKDDFVEVCFRILEQNLTQLNLEEQASVLIYKVPPNYGGYAASFSSLAQKAYVGTPVNLSNSYNLAAKYGDRIRVYPGAMELRDNGTYALKSRAVGILGIGKNIEEARQISLEGIRAVNGGGLWNRTDIASKLHIQQSKKHMEALRRKK